MDQKHVQVDDDEDEALSLSDLPLFHQWRKEKTDEDFEEKNKNSSSSPPTREDEFDFCSFSKESEMCAADEVFFQGQILPLRHSVSSEKGLSHQYDGRRHHRSYSISRSDSMDRYYSSRSSSMSSGSGSRSSSSTTTTTTTTAAKYKPKLPPRNQFHSHPSPSPRLHIPSSRHGGVAAANPIKRSSVWNVLRLGLVATPPELAYQDLKTRPSKHFGSRNSTSSNSSSISGGGGASKKKKMRPRVLGGCKCAADAVDTVAPRVVIIRRSATESSDNDNDRIIQGGDEIKPTKKHLSHHRTFEWLKQLSVEGAAADGAA